MMHEHSDFLDEISATDPELAASLRGWRDSQQGPVSPDARLESRFDLEPAPSSPARWRGWLRRPVVAFGASFAAVLLLGAGAFALVARDSEPTVAAATTSSLPALAATPDEPGEITLPEDLSEQKSYAGCVFGELSAWFTAGFAGDAAPDLEAACGRPPIPDLGPEAEAFRGGLQEWASCLAGELDSVLPALPDLMKGDLDDMSHFENFETACGEPPDPRDYGLELPFADFDWKGFAEDFEGFEEFDLDMLREHLPEGLLPEDLDLEEWKLRFDEFDFEDFDPEGLLPEGLLPEDFDFEQWKSQLDDFGFEHFDFEFDECDPAELPDGAGELEHFDLKTWFEEFENGKICGFAGFFNPEGLDLEALELDELLSDFELHFGGLGVEGLEGLEDLDLEGLLDSLFGDGELQLDVLFEDLADASA